jgi:hypothetical protein
LFSQDRVAQFINDSFEPVWESVRPVPVVRIDFGNGNVLTRTLHGNILTSVCTAEGHVLDALPGIYTEAAYLDRLKQLKLLAGFTQFQRPADRAAFVRGYHRRQAEALKKNQPPGEFSEALLGRAYVTKSRIELPLETVLLPATRAETIRKPQEDKTPLKADDDVARWKALEEDTRLNEGPRRRHIHEMLAAAGRVRPEKVTRPIYKDVLHADLDDPYLGLGKVLFATYPFAEEDKGK